MPIKLILAQTKSQSYAKPGWPANAAIVFKNKFNNSYRLVYRPNAIWHCRFKYNAAKRH